MAATDPYDYRTVGTLDGDTLALYYPLAIPLDRVYNYQSTETVRTLE